MNFFTSCKTITPAIFVYCDIKLIICLFVDTTCGAAIFVLNDDCLCFIDSLKTWPRPYLFSIYLRDTLDLYARKTWPLPRRAETLALTFRVPSPYFKSYHTPYSHKPPLTPSSFPPFTLLQLLPLSNTSMLQYKAYFFQQGNASQTFFFAFFSLLQFALWQFEIRTFRVFFAKFSPP